MLVVKIRHVLSVAMIAGIGLAGTRASLADWSGKGEAGIVFASGNTDTENANVRLELANTLDRRKHSAGIAAVYAATDDLTTGQRWEIYAQSDHNFDDRDFWFGATRYEDDRFSGFDYQATASTGLGRHFRKSERTDLTATAGIGYKFFETRPTFDATTGLLTQPGDSDSEAVLRGTVDYRRDLTDTTQLTNDFLAELGADNTFLNNELAVQVKINDVLALAVAYALRYNSAPPAGFEESDALATLNLVYEFR